MKKNSEKVYVSILIRKDFRDELPEEVPAREFKDDEIVGIRKLEPHEKLEWLIAHT